MVVHNLLLKLQNRSSESITDAKKLLLTMRENVAVISELTVAVDIRRADSSYDLALIARFDTKEDYQSYLVHPYHVQVGNQLKDNIASMASVCFEE